MRSTRLHSSRSAAAALAAFAGALLISAAGVPAAASPTAAPQQLPGQQQAASPVFEVLGQQANEFLGSCVGLSRSARQYSGRYVIGAPGYDTQSAQSAGRVLAGNTLDGAASLTPILTGQVPQQFVGGTVDVITDFDLLQAGFVGSTGNGSDMAAVGDLNGDGFDDVLLAEGTGTLLSGRASDNLVGIGTLDPNVIGGGFGPLGRGAGCGIEDINGDGVPDLLVGDAQAGGGGRIWLISGADQQLLFTAGGPPGSRFGWSVAAVGDYNQDGTPDFAVGSPGQPLAVDNTAFGAVWIYSGASRNNDRPVRVILGPPSAEFGYDLAPCGDANQDGFDDLLVGGPAAQGEPGAVSPGHVWYLLGSNSGNVQQCAITGLGRKPLLSGNQAGMRFGHTIAGGEDFDGDGDREFLVGSPYWDLDANTKDAGRADYFEFTATPELATWTRWGTSCATSAGTAPRASLSRRPAIGASFRIELTGALPSAPVGVFVSSGFERRDLDAVGLPGCDSYLAVPLSGYRFRRSDSNGRAHVELQLPSAPGLIGRDFVLQWLVFDPAANGFGAVTSDAVLGQVGL